MATITDSSAVSDTIALSLVVSGAADSVSAEDSGAPDLSLVISESADTAPVADVVNLFSQISVPYDSINVDDAPTTSFEVDAADSLVIGDSLAVELELSVQEARADDAVTVLDSVQTSFDLHRDVSDAATHQDALSTALQTHDVVLFDAPDVSDALDVGIAGSESTLDAVEVLDDIQSELILGASANDNVSTNDNVEADASFAPPDAIQAIDVIQVAVSYDRAHAESLQTSDLVFTNEPVLVGETVQGSVSTNNPASFRTVESDGPIDSSTSDRACALVQVGVSTNLGDYVKVLDLFEVELT